MSFFFVMGDLLSGSRFAVSSTADACPALILPARIGPFRELGHYRTAL
jgi:hypothetical protein